MRAHLPLPWRAGLLLASLLVLPLAVLLFAQWPLRELVQAGSREANDLAQIIFALYAAVAVTAASLTHSHMAALPGALAAGSAGASAAAPPERHWQSRARPWALLACLAPWACFMLWAAAPQIGVSLRDMERFSENLTPGYFLIKLSLALMLVLVLLDVLAPFLPLGALRRLRQRHPG